MVSERSYAYAKKVQHATSHFRSQDPLWPRKNTTSLWSEWKITKWVQSEFIRQAIDGAVVKPIIRVNPVNDEVLATLGKLVAEYNKIGNNINQIARTLNEWQSPYPQLADEITAAASDLAALKYEVLQKVGELNGYVQTYQL